MGVTRVASVLVCSSLACCNDGFAGKCCVDQPVSFFLSFSLCCPLPSLSFSLPLSAIVVQTAV